MYRPKKMLIAFTAVMSMLFTIGWILHANKNSSRVRQVWKSPLCQAAMFTTTGLSNINVKATSPTSNIAVYLIEPSLGFDKIGNASCLTNKDIKWRMVIFVKSSVGNFHRREFIRRAWGSLSYLEDGLLKTLFVVGKPNSAKNGMLLAEETRRYEDILQYDGPDTYRNIVSKTLAGMQWAAENLLPDDFYTTADDDVLINLAEMHKILTYFLKAAAEKKWPEFPLLCMYRIVQPFTPERNVNSKYFVSEKDYRWQVWPRSCLGAMYTTSVSVINQLWVISKGYKPLPMDDVWVTGVLREHMGMPAQMVIKPEGHVATHTSGYSGKKSKNIRDFMSDEVTTMLKELTNKTTCFWSQKRPE